MGVTNMCALITIVSQTILCRKNLSDIYPQSQLRILLMLLYLSVSQHVSAPMGHPQVNTINYLKHLRESHRYHNGSIVHKFVSYYIEGKYIVILQ
jgi:hypothetical protein